MKSILIFFAIFISIHVCAATRHKTNQKSKEAPHSSLEPTQNALLTQEDGSLSPFLKKTYVGGSSFRQYFQTHSVKLYDGIKNNDRLFYTHVTTPAAALPAGDMSFETYPGARGFDSFLVNSLSIGTWRGLQLGVIPFYYFLKFQNADGDVRFTSSFTYKWNFLSFQNWDFSLGGSSISYNQKFADGIVNTDTGQTFYSAKLTMTWTSLMINYFFKNYPIAIGLNTSRILVSSDNSYLDKQLDRDLNTKSKTEVAWDINYLYNDDWNFTLGFGRYKPSAAELYKTYPGIGVTTTHIRHTQWFNRISGGIHWLDGINSFRILFSFSI